VFNDPSSKKAQNNRYELIFGFSSLLYFAGNTHSSIPAHEPLTFQEANIYMSRHQAMHAEIHDLHCSSSWLLVSFQLSTNVISSCRVYKIKCRADGNVERCKAHIIARGFT
jgi:hypothetical protein